jgi:sarcosine oxidase subunit alpha
VSRLASGGRVDRSAPLRFTFDGRDHTGYHGDTLASALLAAGVRTVAHSIHLGRPRGVYAAGAEEPNALVQVESGGCPEPMLKATQVELYDGLRARGLRGRGIVPIEPDTAIYDKTYLHCDVLVVGGGPAGLAAALAASRTGARVVLVDEQPELGGDLLGTRQRIDGAPALDWVSRVAAELAASDEVRVLTRATAVGYYDHNHVLVAERRTDHLGDAAPAHLARQRLWHIRAAQAVLATGAHERPLVFADNDRPGIMLASAARTYVNRYAVAPGRRAAVFTNNDSAYAAALDLLGGGVDVAAVVDVRGDVSGAWPSLLRDRGVEVLGRHAVTGTNGDDGLSSVTVAALTAGGEIGPARSAYDVDLLVVSGGWNPAVHLASQSQGKLRYDDRLACFVPHLSAQPERSVGAAAGEFGLAAAIADGAQAGAEASAQAGFAGGEPVAVVTVPALPETPIEPAWIVPAEDGDWDRHFVDLQRDSTVSDVLRAAGTGMRSVEHVKRYTTIGTANDQGKTSGVTTVGILSGVFGIPMAEIGTVTFRPPYSPVAFGLLAGRDRGRLSDPARVTPIQPWHVANGAVFEDVGQWKRPRFFPRGDEDMDAAVLRECAAARTKVAVMDATTLGKIDIQGPDAGEFLNRIYTNAFAKLAVGSCRYGVMCRADGMVFDDGVTTRLAEDRFLMTTTTGNAAPVLDWLEEWLQTEWPELKVYCTSVTEQWATVAVVGPRSRAVVGALAPGIDVSNEAFPFMTWREGMVAGLPARVCRISFSGELAYEINVATWHGLAIWEAVLAAGERHGITPYGTETMHVLRAEKGFPIVGQDTDGTVTPQDLGMEWVVSKTKDFIGRRSHSRPDTARVDRKRLVGLLPVDPDEVLPEGAQLVASPDETVPMRMVGHVTSSYRSAALGRSFALALVLGGTDQLARTLYAPLLDRTVPVTVTEPVLYDKEGARRDG